jgi:divalent metal cation (Fe/Co/Zn/Cd) transporter
VGLTLITGDGMWDGIGTVAIGVLLVAVAVFLAVETKSLLIGEAASPEAVTAIERAITSVPGVDSVIHMRTLHLGPEELLVAAKIAVPPGSSAANIASAIDAAEAAARAAEPTARVIYLEPDLRRGAEPAGETPAGATSSTDHRV